VKKLQPFQLADTALNQGVTLIEASAGTGKTFTIAGLILRLVIEQGFSIGQILAVTYTVAATGELRDRVRKRLRRALEDLRRGESEDEVVRKFLEGGSVKKGIMALDAAVQNFDEAQIFTIHGFCQRVLRENAFESGAVFDTELLPDSSPIIDEVARDFWRRRFYEAPPLLSRLALAQGLSHGKWAELLNRLRNHPDIHIFPGPGKLDCASLASQIKRKFKAVIGEWERAGEQVTEILMEDKSLSRNQKAYHPDRVREMTRSLDALAANFETSPPESLNAIAQLSASVIADNLLKDKMPPKHIFFDLCEDFSVSVAQYFDRLTHEFIDFARVEMPLRKARLNVQTYDDLLTRLRDALADEAGTAFREALGFRYRAALIDEFQDTDPVQYDIFTRIFGRGKHFLYFIGDPKQAIYGFRGADVFTYLRASEEASAKFTLGTNWRSEKRLLDAINLLFRDHPSLGRGIEYHEVSPPQNPCAGFHELTGDERQARLRFRFLKSDDPAGSEFNQADAETKIVRAVAADIVRLKAGGGRLGARPLKFGDMAVLVRTNMQAARLQEMLRAAGVRSVLKTDQNVFRTQEARDLLMLLEGLLEPGRGHFLNTALITVLFGIVPLEIVGIEGDESARQKKLEQFMGWRAEWKQSCFIAMFRSLLLEQNVRERLVQMPGGERKLTNFLHLAELLHREETARQLTPEALRVWLREQIHSDDSGEGHQLRLESDDDAVLLATIHKSKGLEYPVVFCPFPWKAADNPRRSEILFHDPENKNRLTLDLRDKSEAALHDSLTAEEKRGESLRMLYVALTRAQNLCHVYTGDISKFETSPLAAILGGTPPMPALQALEKQSGGNLDVTLIDPEADDTAAFLPWGCDDTEKLQAREFVGAISQTRMIASFSGLVSDGAKEEADRDSGGTEVADAAEQPVPDALAGFERGVRAGLFWHDLLENLDFENPGMIRDLVAGKLASHGLDETYNPAICDRLLHLLTTTLQPGFALQRISRRERLSEVEFSYPIAALTPEKIRAVFARHAGGEFSADFSSNLGRLDFRPVEGFMRGFIDLLFRFEDRYYIVDWKSNLLGQRAEDYSGEALRNAMLGSFYFLQYHLYTVAAELFLRARLPGFDYGRQFGGVFYFFLRGVHSGHPGRGVFHDCPDAALIHDLCGTLTGRNS
jgi:exodeoxyribonuclease V beta subunit